MDALFIAGILILGLVVMIFVPQWRLKRAIPQVIRIFRRANATTAKEARFVDELGLKKRGFLDGMMKGRDYKPFALDVLAKAEIVQATEEGRLFLSEERLSASPLKEKLRIPAAESMYR